ncbi:hypothetical protein ACLB2K_062560 [Fragaria x ananassa]
MESALLRKGVLVEKVRELLTTSRATKFVHVSRSCNGAAHEVTQFVARFERRYSWLGVIGSYWLMGVINGRPSLPSQPLPSRSGLAADHLHLLDGGATWRIMAGIADGGSTGLAVEVDNGCLCKEAEICSFGFHHGSSLNPILDLRFADLWFLI